MLLNYILTFHSMKIIAGLLLNKYICYLSVYFSLLDGKLLWASRSLHRAYLTLKGKKIFTLKFIFIRKKVKILIFMTVHVTML